VRVLVTGGCGFIGANLVRHLLQAGHQLRVLDNLSVGRRENLPTNSNGASVELLVGDICQPAAVRSAIQGVDAVVHMAAYTSVVDSLAHPEDCFHTNALGTLTLLEACRQLGVRRFVLASSNAAVGEQAPPIDEGKVPRPLSMYGASKLAGEALCSTYHHSYGLETVALRFANAYGPHCDHKTSVVALFMKRAQEGHPLTIYGDGSQTRDFVHATDICQAISLCLAHDGGNGLAGEVFQVASGVETRIGDLARLVMEVTGRDLAVVQRPERTGEIRRNYSDIAKARERLGFQPKVSLRRGLEELWKWLGRDDG